MNAFRQIVYQMRRALGIPGLARSIDRQMLLLEDIARKLSVPEGSSGLEILPGTPYSRYALPVDYLPSRNFHPRWGNDRPPIGAFAQWFAKHEHSYKTFLGYLRGLKLGHIPISWEGGADSIEAAWLGGAVAPFDLLALYGMVSRARPRRYVEIGSGISTCFARQAIDDFRLACRVISVDPEPRGRIDKVCDEIVREPLEALDIAFFDQCERGDIVFLDGTHRSFMNSDVTVFFIDVLPRLKPGVIVHIHDVVLPWDYPESFKHWYWNEQYLLAVYMMASQHRIDPVLPTAWICRSQEFAQDLREPFVDLGKDNPGWLGGGSMWFTHTERIASAN